MIEIKAVIGKNFGDEGKGKCVDALCADALARGRNPLVVRHNGGAQAGHTVEAKDFRFVFHQLGSGSRCGTPVYWSSTFLPDLLKLGDEVEAFEREQEKSGRNRSRGNRGSGRITVYASPDCVCTTVYDVLLNSFAESLRGEARHGSCGMGIYETVCRARRDPDKKYTFCLGKLQGKNVQDYMELLRNIRDHYVPQRVDEILLEARERIPDKDSLLEKNEWISLMENANLLFHAAEGMWENYNRYLILAQPETLFRDYDTIIFENAQGLMLDEDNTPYYPHLTPSHTGLFNIKNILSAASAETGTGETVMEADIHYVTRTYITRHGRGRLDYECRKEDINSGMKDLTNVPNEWQGTLRYAKHSPLADFFEPLDRETSLLSDSLNMTVRVWIDVTHLDETGGKLLFCDGNREIGKFQEECAKRGMRAAVL